MKRSLRSVQCNVAADQAREIVLASCESFTPVAERCLFYPFHRFHFQFLSGISIWKRKVDAFCLVDLINREASTTDRFETVETPVDEADILKGVIDRDDALALAREYVSHAAIHLMKRLAAPDLELVDEDPLWVPYWILRCDHPDKPPFRVVVSGMNGQMQLL